MIHFMALAIVGALIGVYLSYYLEDIAAWCTCLPGRVYAWFWNFRRPWWHPYACGCSDRKRHF